MKIRSRKFEGRCGKHKDYNPGVDGRAGARNCPRCGLLCDIWETALKLNQAIRRFDPRFDDAKPTATALAAEPDPRQLSLISD